jgi:hypothetical protein
MAIRRETVQWSDLVNWGRAGRGEVRVVVEGLSGGDVAVVSMADLETLEDGERFEAATEPPNDQDRCLECGLPRMIGPYMRAPSLGCSMCEAHQPRSRAGRRWVDGAWRRS